MIDEIHNAYLALELEPGAALPQVQEAWREQVTVWHPDRFSGNLKLQRKAQERTKDINAAYNILKQFLKDSSTPHLRPEVAGEPHKPPPVDPKYRREAPYAKSQSYAQTSQTPEPENRRKPTDTEVNFGETVGGIVGGVVGAFIGGSVGGIVGSMMFLIGGIIAQ